MLQRSIKIVLEDIWKQCFHAASRASGKLLDKDVQRSIKSALEGTWKDLTALNHLCTQIDSTLLHPPEPPAPPPNPRTLNIAKVTTVPPLEERRYQKHLNMRIFQKLRSQSII